MTTAQGWVALAILVTFAGIIITILLQMMTSLRNELIVRIDSVSTVLTAKLDAEVRPITIELAAIRELLTVRFDALDKRLSRLEGSPPSGDPVRP